MVEEFCFKRLDNVSFFKKLFNNCVLKSSYLKDLDEFEASVNSRIAIDNNKIEGLENLVNNLKEEVNTLTTSNKELVKTNEELNKKCNILTASFDKCVIEKKALYTEVDTLEQAVERIRTLNNEITALRLRFNLDKNNKVVSKGINYTKEQVYKYISNLDKDSLEDLKLIVINAFKNDKRRNVTVGNNLRKFGDIDGLVRTLFSYQGRQIKQLLKVYINIMNK